MKAPIKSADEFQIVFAHCAKMERPKMYRLMMLLSVKLGLRPMEIAGLQREWFRGDELRIPLGHSKRKSGRSLPVDAEILNALDEHMGSQRGTVFSNARGEAFSAAGVSDAMRRLYREAGVQGSCYSGRRSMATRMVDNGINIAIISKVLGHSDISTTAAYLSITPKMMARALFA